MTAVTLPPEPALDARSVPAPLLRADRGHRVLVALAAIGILGPAFATWSGIIMVPLTGFASVMVTAGSLALLVCAAATGTERGLRRVEVALLVLGVVTLASWTASVIAANPAYGTDEAAFEQYAAHLLVHGLDPYRHTLLPALREFRVPIQYATYTTSGGVVGGLGYPALPVLLVVPFAWLTGGVQAVPVLNAVALGAGMVVAFLVLPRRYRALAVVAVVGLPILFGYAVSGVNVILAVPFLVVVAWRFTETGAGGRLGRRGVLQALCLGLAISTQQMAWFFFPFVVVAVWTARRGELGRRGAASVSVRYTGIAVATFLAVNAWFILSGPGAWLRGVLEPLVQHAIPYGQGLVDLPVFAGIGGGDIGLFTCGAIAVLLGLLLCLHLFFRSLWRCTFLMPSLALFFPTRSLAEYWMTMITVWLVSLFASPPGATLHTVGGVPGTRAPSGPRWGRVLVAAAGFVPSLGLLGVAASSAAPLSLAVSSIRTNGQYGRVWELTVKVTNRSARPLRPHFATNSIGQMTPFWHVLQGPPFLAPRARATYRLAAPNVGAMPGITEPFQLDAVTDSPETISVTHDIVTEPYTAWIYQSDVNRVLHSGDAVPLTVELRNPFGGPVDRKGVVVALGQIIYTQTSLLPGEARIDGRPPGQSPVEARTDAHGRATFVVRDLSPQGQPIYFQAWVVARAGYPFGYSETVDVLWGGG